jgi:hypothetical protein
MFPEIDTKGMTMKDWSIFVKLTNKYERTPNVMSSGVFSTALADITFYDLDHPGEMRHISEKLRHIFKCAPDVMSNELFMEDLKKNHRKTYIRYRNTEDKVNKEAKLTKEA